jgi:hypothetical protein
MNRYDPNITPGREARLRYLDGDYQVVIQGDYVRCAMTGQPIKLDDLRYWSVARQEAYASAALALKRHLELEEAR